MKRQAKKSLKKPWKRNPKTRAQQATPQPEQQTPRRHETQIHNQA